jgi:ribosomal protein S12 methylthiotransferase accessory factor
MTTGVVKKTRREPMRVRFPGGLKVEADYRGFSIPTDQSERHGGSGSAPPPFDLFLASIATCAGFYALQFLRKRDLPTAGLALALEPRTGEGGGRIEQLRLIVDLPTGFPEKYRKPLERAIDQCAVKRHIVEPPEFETVLESAV